jgi:hypothetical protein
VTRGAAVLGALSSNVALGALGALGACFNPTFAPLLLQDLDAAAVAERARAMSGAGRRPRQHPQPVREQRALGALHE